MASASKSAALARFSPLSLARLVWKGKLWLLLVWIAVTVAGFAIVIRMKPMYRAETLILVESQKIPDKYVSSTVISDVQDRLATISQEILSTTRLKKIIEDYKLYSEERSKHAFEDVVEVMRHDVDVKVEKGWTNNRPGAFRISYQGSDPTVVAAVANRLASLYIDENLKVREDQAQDTSEFLNAQLKDAKKTLDDLEASVSRYKVEHNGELPQQEATINNTLMRLQTQLQGAQDSMNRAQQNKTIYDAELGSIDLRLSGLLATREAARSDGAVQPRMTSGPQAPEPVKSSKVLTDQLNALRARYSDEHPEVQHVRASLAAALRAEQQSAPPAPHVDNAAAVAAPPAPQMRLMPLSPELTREAEQLRQRAATLKAQREIADHEIEVGAAQRADILKEMGAYQSQLKKLPVREQEMAGLTRDYEMAKANYRSLLDKKTSADMATDMEHRQKAERFMVLDPAQVPEKPFKPNKALFVSISTILGLALGALLSIGKEWPKDLFLGEWELPPGVKILGRIPQIEIGREPGPKKRNREIKSPAIETAVSVALFVFWLASGMRGGHL